MHKNTILPKLVSSISLVLGFCTYKLSAEQHNLAQFTGKHPFSYDLGVKVIPSKTHPHQVTLCCHGYGHNRAIVDMVHALHAIKGNLVGFNFPDYNITEVADHRNSAFGTIEEILPLLYLIHYYACTVQVPSLNLYGFSAGGGAIVNALAVLNKKLHSPALARIGISEQDTQRMLRAVEKGHIVLDCPLKSMQELIDFRGTSPNLEIVSKRYEKNKMSPLDNLSQLAGLKLTIIAHFQNPDEILGNRDDQLFIERLKQANQGTTVIIIGSEGGHNGNHTSLWNQYKKLF